jgi:hypothetical protein
MAEHYPPYERPTSSQVDTLYSRWPLSPISRTRKAVADPQPAIKFSQQRPLASPSFGKYASDVLLLTTSSAFMIMQPCHRNFAPPSMEAVRDLSVQLLQ